MSTSLSIAFEGFQYGALQLFKHVSSTNKDYFYLFHLLTHRKTFDLLAFCRISMLDIVFNKKFLSKIFLSNIYEYLNIG